MPQRLIILALLLSPAGLLAQEDGAPRIAPAAPTLSSVRPNAGPADARMTLHLEGTQFESFGTLTVTIGTIPLEGLVVESDTSLRGELPAGLAEGTYDVVMTSEVSSQTTLRAAYTVTPAGSPVPPYIEAWTPTQALPGDTLCVTGEGIEDGAVVRIGGEVAEASAGEGLCARIPELEDGVYGLSVTNPDGGSDRIEDALRVGSIGSADDCACSALRADTPRPRGLPTLLAGLALGGLAWRRSA